MEKNNTKTYSISLGSVCLAWGFITQCLQWAGVISWSLWAIWGPFLLCLAVAGVALIIAVIAGVIAMLLDR